MKNIKFLLLLLLVPTVAYSVTRGDDTVRVGVSRSNQTSARMSGVAGTVKSVGDAKAQASYNNYYDDESNDVVVNNETSDSNDCRDAYRECMDNFCLLDESQGERCACSNNINRAKPKINEVLKIQGEADNLFTEGVEREKLGAKARLVFTDSTPASNKTSSVDFMAWLNAGSDDVGEDTEIGADLYDMAAEYCADELKSCGKRAEMEEKLYTRMIAQDCKNYDAYLVEQKANAESNKRIAESAVRKARLEMLDTTNKYNRGECLLAYRSCIADKGGCGANFENCLDAGLLRRRSNACENVLDQCMSVREYVEQDWAEESKSVLADAAKYADTYKRENCNAKVQLCLEENCSTSTDSLCLTNVKVAAGICPIITECNEMIPGFKDGINDKLGLLQTKFCQNDVDKCLQEKCGVDYTKPECVGKASYEIAALCPQDMFPSCKNAEFFNIIVQSAMLQMDYQMLTGCANYFGEQLSKVCGSDMSCLPIVASVENLTKLPTKDSELADLRATVSADSDAAVEEFFQQFESDKTVAACADSQSKSGKRVKGRNSLGESVFNTAKLLAKMSAENRNLRALDTKIAELTRKESTEKAEKICLETYKVESPKNSKTNYMYIKSVSFEPNLRNCHVCRMQQVCETGGEGKGTTALKTAAAGLTTGASLGAMDPAGLGVGWGSAIGAVGGALVGGIGGYLTAEGRKDYCQQIESCEDINM